MPVFSSPMVMPIPTSTGAQPVVNSAPMTVGSFPAAKPTLTPIEANPPSQKFTGMSPVVKPTAIPTEAKLFDDSAGLCPVAKSSPKPTYLHSVIQSIPTPSSTVAVNPPAPTMKINETNRTNKQTPPTAGNRPARNQVQNRTDQVQTPNTAKTHPAISRALMPSGIHPVLGESPKKQYIVVVLKFDQPPLSPPPVTSSGAYEQFHSDTRPRKPPDGPPKHIRSSEAIVERVSQTRPHNDQQSEIIRLNSSLCFCMFWPRSMFAPTRRSNREYLCPHFPYNIQRRHSSSLPLNNRQTIRPTMCCVILCAWQAAPSVRSAMYCVITGASRQ